MPIDNPVPIRKNIAKDIAAKKTFNKKSLLLRIIILFRKIQFLMFKIYYTRRQTQLSQRKYPPAKSKITFDIVRRSESQSKESTKLNRLFCS